MSMLWVVSVLFTDNCTTNDLKCVRGIRFAQITGHPNLFCARANVFQKVGGSTPTQLSLPTTRNLSCRVYVLSAIPARVFGVTHVFSLYHLDFAQCHTHTSHGHTQMCLGFFVFFVKGNTFCLYFMSKKIQRIKAKNYNTGCDVIPVYCGCGVVVLWCDSLVGCWGPCSLPPVTQS